jgi:hypothetical protein
MQFCLCWISKSASNCNIFFSLVIDLRFMQFDPRLTIKLSIFFNFTSDFNQLGPHSLSPFLNLSLAANFFNLTPNWPQNFNWLAIFPWFQLIDLTKIKFGLLKLQSSQLSLNWASKLNVSPLKPLIKLIWPFLKYN